MSATALAGTFEPPAACDFAIAVFTTAGSFCIARAWTGSTCARAPRSLITRFERLDLCGELAGRGAVAAVFHLQQRVGRAQLVDLGPRAPFGAEADQNRQRERGGSRDDRQPKVDRQRAARPRWSGLRLQPCNDVRSLRGVGGRAPRPQKPRNSITHLRFRLLCPHTPLRAHMPVKHRVAVLTMVLMAATVVFAQGHWNHLQGPAGRPDEPRPLADLLGRLYRPALQPAHADHPGQRRPAGAAWTFQTGVVNKFEATPLVIDGVLYMTGPLNHAWAIDARTGSQIWHYQRQLPQGLKVCCGMVNRGFAVLRRPALHGDARRAFRRARDEDRQGDLRHRDGGDKGRLRGHRRAADREGQGDCRRSPAASSRTAASSTPTIRRPASALWRF